MVSAKEEDEISRKLLAHLNTFPDIPISIDLIDYEFMDSDETGMSLSLIQSTYIIERNIIGGYTADYQFKIVYRVKTSSPHGRLQADELLNQLGDWLEKEHPDLGESIRIETLEQATRSSLFARMDGGWEDHQIFMRMTYKVR